MAYALVLLRSSCRKGRYLKNISLATRDITPVTSTYCSRLISTSNKDKNVAPLSIEEIEKSEEYKRLRKHFADTSEDNEENYHHYGYDPVDRDNDWFQNHFKWFYTFSFTLCWALFILMYRPDVRETDWVTREAFLQLERREREGLPLVDMNYIDPAKMILPDDDELGDTEIVI